MAGQTSNGIRTPCQNVGTNFREQIIYEQRESSPAEEHCETHAHMTVTELLSDLQLLGKIIDIVRFTSYFTCISHASALIHKNRINAEILVFQLNKLPNRYSLGKLANVKESRRCSILFVHSKYVKALAVYLTFHAAFYLVRS